MTMRGARSTSCSIHGSIASRQRNVFLRNDGRGGFDEISGALGLDLDQDGRSFAVLDSIATAIRTSRSWRRGRRRSCASSATTSRRSRRVASRSGSRARRATATRSARASRVETDRLRKTKIVQAGSGFLSQHSKELLVGLGAERAHREAHRAMAVGRDAGVHRRAAQQPRPASSKAAASTTEPLRRAQSAATAAAAEPSRRVAAGRRPGSTSRSRRRTSRSRTCAARRARSRRCRGSRRSCCSGRPTSPASRAALEALGRGARTR